MDISHVVAVASFALASSITPGPNNLMLATSGLRFGFRGTIPLMLGIEVGFLLLLLTVAMGLGSAFEQVPALHAVMKLLAIAYLMYLAWQLWQSTDTAVGASRSAGFLRGAAFQVVNPKAWMMTVGAASAYTSVGVEYWPSVWTMVGLFTAAGMISTMVWTAFGAALRDKSTPRRLRHVSRGMALLTAGSGVLVLL